MILCKRLYEQTTKSFLSVLKDILEQKCSRDVWTLKKKRLKQLFQVALNQGYVSLPIALHISTI